MAAGKVKPTARPAKAELTKARTGDESIKETEAVPEAALSDNSESSSEDDDEPGGVDLSRLDDESSSDSELEPVLEESSDRKAGQNGHALGHEESEEEDDNDDEEDDDEEAEDEVEIESLGDIDSGLDEDEVAATIRTRQTIYNKEGLLNSLRRFAIVDIPSTTTTTTSSSAPDATNALSSSSKKKPKSTTAPALPFSVHQSLASSAETAASIPDVHDDLQRELAFVAQSLDAARRGRALLRLEKVPFSRPKDYFAEMLRADETMDRVRTKLVEVAAAKKAATEARRQRDLRKFGKQVQVARQQDRAREKRDTLDKITSLKRKRKENPSSLGATEADDLFDVAVDKELGQYDGAKSGKNNKRPAPGSGGGGGGDGGPNAKRQRKDTKYGSGGRKRGLKSNDALSSGDLSGFNERRMRRGGGAQGGRVSKGSAGGSRGGGPAAAAANKKRGPAPRLGKSRRKSMGRK